MDNVTAPARDGSRYWIALIAIGIIGGLLSGAFGVGGGILMVPLLISLAGMDQRIAAATSLVAIVPASMAGFATYAANGEVDLIAGAIVAIGAIAGAVLGSQLLRRLSLSWLRWLFIALLVLVAVRMILIAPVRGAELELSWPVAFGLVALGLVMGVASGLFGIGGGVIAVPAFIALFGMGDLIAKGTSLLVMIPTALSGTVSNVRGKIVDVRAGIVVGLAATAASFGGVAIAFLVPPRLSSVLFALLLAFAAVQLTIKAIRARR